MSVIETGTGAKNVAVFAIETIVTRDSVPTPHAAGENR